MIEFAAIDFETTGFIRGASNDPWQLGIAVVRDGEIVIRNIMKITMSADHRVIDGSMAAEFVNAVKAKLEDGELWKSMI